MKVFSFDLLWSPLPGLAHGHDPLPVAVSLFVAVLAAYTALSLSENLVTARGMPRLLWLLASAVALGGGIWTMHFTAMLAFALPVPLAYDPWLTLLSCVVAIGFTAAALALVARFGARTIVILLAGLMAGLAIAAMHYLGMAAMRFAGQIVFAVPHVLLSVAIAVLAATAALWLVFRGTNLFERFAAALLMGAAIAGMHYTAMAGAHFHLEEAAAALGPHLLQERGYEFVLALGFGVSCLLGLVLFRSVVDRQRAVTAEAQLAAAERERSFVENALGNISEAVVALDRDGCVRYAAGRGVEALEASCGRLHGQELAECMPPGLREPLRREIARAWVEGQAGPLDLSLPTPDEPTIFELTLRQVPTEGQGLLIATLHNVTARAVLLREIERARSNAEAGDRMKSSFLASMSHELRTPLNAVIGFSELIQMQGTRLTAAQLESYSGDVLTAGRQLLGVVEAVLDFARVSAGHLHLRAEPTAPVELLAAVEEGQRQRAGLRQVTLVRRVPRGASEVLVDRASWSRALIRLLENAIDFSPPGGRVEMGIESDPETGEVAFFVQDEGPGIEPALLPSLTQPFVQLEPHLTRSRQGLGLGLALARGVVEAHNGRLEIDSHPGRGTRARLVLPAARCLAAMEPSGRPERYLH